MFSLISQPTDKKLQIFSVRSVCRLVFLLRRKCGDGRRRSEQRHQQSSRHVVYSRASDLQNSAPHLPPQFEDLTKCPQNSRYPHSVVTSITSKHYAYFTLYYFRSSTHLSQQRGAHHNKMAVSTRRWRQASITLHSTRACSGVSVSVCDCVFMWVCRVSGHCLSCLYYAVNIKTY
jgi:hypothetical protein